MKTKILLVNFNEGEKEKIQSLGIDADLGYISNVVSFSHDKKIGYFDFYFPLSAYEYKAVFIKLVHNPAIKLMYTGKTKRVTKDDVEIFFKYWWRKRGVLTLFVDETNFSLLSSLGITNVELKRLAGRDETVRLGVDDENRPFRKAFREIMPLIDIPPKMYIEVKKRKGSYEEGSWHIDNIYENLNDQALGVYHNSLPDYENADAPRFIILPPYRDYSTAVIKILKALALIYPKTLSTILDADWVTSDKYFPKEVIYFDQQINQLLDSTKSKIEKLRKSKTEAKEKYSFLRSILCESGNNLKDAVINVLSNIWGLDIEDADKTRKTKLSEDILVKVEGKVILGEVKGTESQNPSPKYIAQLFSHQLKSKYKDSVGALILNHDLKRDPAERTIPYADDEEQLSEIIFLDTRVLFDLSIAILDHGLSTMEAVKILLKPGRVKFDLNDHIESKLKE